MTESLLGIFDGCSGCGSQLCNALFAISSLHSRIQLQFCFLVLVDFLVPGRGVLCIASSAATTTYTGYGGRNKRPKSARAQPPKPIEFNPFSNPKKPY